MSVADSRSSREALDRGDTKEIALRKLRLCKPRTGSLLFGELRFSCVSAVSGYVYVEQCQPILQRLQCKTTEDERDSEGSEPPFRKIVGIVFNVRSYRYPNAGDQAGYQPYPDGKG